MKEIQARGYTEREKQMAKNEIINLKTSNHKNIVKFVDDFYGKHCFQIVMEYCSGGDLADGIAEQNGIPFSTNVVLSWYRQLSV